MTSRLARILTLVVLLAQLASAAPQFSDLVKALQAEDDAQAVELSLKLEAAGQISFGLYYNQGLAYLNQNQENKARASFEKALTFSPRHLETRRRLKETKEKLSPQLAEVDAVGTPWWSAREAFSTLLVLAVALIVTGARCLWGQGSRGHLWAATILFASALALVIWSNPTPRRAVVVSGQTMLLAQPKSDSSGTVLLDGCLVGVQTEKGHYLEVFLRNGQKGWVRKAQVVEI